MDKFTHSQSPCPSKTIMAPIILIRGKNMKKPVSNDNKTVIPMFTPKR